MKKIVRMSLVCAVLFSGISTYAIDGNEEMNLHVIKMDGKSFTFALNKVQKANLSIYDEDGLLIYTEKATGKDGILRTFNLQQFPEGTYYLEVEDDTKTIKHEIRISEGGSAISRKAFSSVYKVNSNKNTGVALR